MFDTLKIQNNIITTLTNNTATLAVVKTTQE